MKKVILTALLWGAIMFGALVILDLLRENPINWFIAGCAGVVFFVFKLMLGYAEEMARRR